MATNDNFNVAVNVDELSNSAAGNITIAKISFKELGPMLTLPAGSQELVLKEREAYWVELQAWELHEADWRMRNGKTAHGAACVDDDGRELVSKDCSTPPDVKFSDQTPAEHTDKLRSEVTRFQYTFTLVPPRKAVKATSPKSGTNSHIRSRSFTEYQIKIAHGKSRSPRRSAGAGNPFEIMHNGAASPVTDLPSEILVLIISPLLKDLKLSESGYHDGLVIKNNAVCCDDTSEELVGLQNLSLASRRLSSEICCTLLKSVPFRYTIQGGFSSPNTNEPFWSGVAQAPPVQVKGKSTLHAIGLVLNIYCDPSATGMTAALRQLCERIQLFTETKDIIIRWNFYGNDWFLEQAENESELRFIKASLVAAIEQMPSIERYHIQVERFAVFAARGGKQEWDREGIHRITSDDDVNWMFDAKLDGLKWDLHVGR